MRKNVVIVPMDMTVMDAANKMLDMRIGSLIVVKDNKPVGIVTETDIVRKVVASGVSSRVVAMEDIMSKKVMTIDASESIAAAGKMMEKYRIKRLPVMDKEKIVGIITATDIIGYVASS